MCQALDKYYVTIADDNTLTIMNVDYETDAGDYVCVGKNEAGVAQASVTVTLHGPNDTANSGTLAITTFWVTVFFSSFVLIKNLHTFIDFLQKSVLTFNLSVKQNAS